MLRLTGGEFRGRLIKTPPHLETRPTQARLRQALFNSIQTVIQESNVLDLFAGSEEDKERVYTILGRIEAGVF